MTTSGIGDFALGQPRIAHQAPAGTAHAEITPATWAALLVGPAPGLPQERLAAEASGAFAFATTLPDGSRAMAVDRFARDTLCYTVRDGRVLAAERADELATPDTPLDPQAIYDYLFFHAIPSPRTVFKGVHRLTAGHLARSNGDQVTVEPFWTPRFSPPARTPSFEALKSEFRNLLAEAVRSSVDAGKAGCFLSGGTDSSTVAGMAAQVTGGRAATYSIGFEAEGYDEMAFARIAARHFGTEHHEYYVTPADLIDSVPKMARWLDQPFGNSSVVPAYHCALMARNDGVTRMLAGDGGDELFGGNSRYAKQRVFDAYGLLPAWLRRSVIEPLVQGRDGSSLALMRKAASYVEQARLPMPERTHLYNLLLRLGPEEVLEPAFLAQVNRGDPGRQQRKVWEAADAAHAIDRTLAFDWRYTLAESDLPKVRAATSLAGVQVAYPMLDESLVAFSQKLPTEWKLRGLKLRWFFKEALRGFLPDEIITKKKQGFGLPFGVWTTRHEGLRRMAEDSLGSLATRGIVRPAFMKNLIEQRIHEHPGYYGEMVWILMMLEQWLRHHRPNHRFDA